MSFIVSTFSAMSTPRPMNAMLVTLRPSLSAKIQPATITTKVTAVIHSSRDSGPMLAIAARAAAGASGVAPTRGGNSLETSRGNNPIATSAGTQEAMSQDPNPISTPNFCEICTPIGLADVAVIHSAEETARLAIVQNMR